MQGRRTCLSCQKWTKSRLSVLNRWWDIARQTRRQEHNLRMARTAQPAVRANTHNQMHALSVKRNSNKGLCSPSSIPSIPSLAKWITKLPSCICDNLTFVWPWMAHLNNFPVFEYYLWNSNCSLHLLRCTDLHTKAGHALRTSQVIPCLPRTFLNSISFTIRIISHRFNSISSDFCMVSFHLIFFSLDREKKTQFAGRRSGLQNHLTRVHLCVAVFVCLVWIGVESKGWTVTLL